MTAAGWIMLLAIAAELAVLAWVIRDRRRRGVRLTMGGREVEGWRVPVAWGLFVAFFWAGVILHPFLRLAGRRGCVHRIPPGEDGTSWAIDVTPDSFTRWPDEERDRISRP